MYKVYTFFLSILFLTNLAGQNNSLNMELLSNLPYPNSLNDIWGYVAPDGHEYAIVGTVTKTSVVDLADPRNPVEVAEFPGSFSTWRDMKHFGEFVYVTTDVGQDGLLVIDMRGAPENITGEFWRPEIEINGVADTFNQAHNIFIDEDGYAYLAGGNLNSGGNLIIDVFTTPGQPQFVGASDPRYAHDVMVQDDLMYSSDIFAGFFSVVDVSDKTDPITLATQITTSDFTHNAWVSTDGNYLFTTDERANANVDAYDISDLTNITRLDVFQPEETKGLNSIPHNTHYFNGYLVTSWYTDGVRIVDANKPDNLVEVAYYDTYLSDQIGDGFRGVWGVTPYLPSGLVIASDINTGLYVFETDYIRAAYLEGNITDANTGLPIIDADVIIESDQLNSKTSNALGDYKTGLAQAGEYTVNFSKPGYESAAATVSIVSGEVTVLDIALVPAQSFAITGTVRSIEDNRGIANAGVLIVNDVFEYEVMTDEDGKFTIDAAIEGEYEVFAGAWGFENILFNPASSVTEDQDFEITLSPAYMDDFIVDMGWTAESFAGTGDWVREVPIGTITGGSFSNPNEDVEGDIGNKAYVTGNAEGGVGDADIDDGTVVLTSPMMDLTDFTNPEISYSLWFFNGGGNGNPNDGAIVRISNGTTSAEVEILNPEDSEGAWRPTNTFTISDFVEITSTMQFSVEASDFGSGHLVEAGLDNFSVSGAPPVTTGDLVFNDAMEVLPNPFDESTIIRFDEEITGTMTVTNLIGQFVEQIDLENANQIELGSQYSNGTYFLSLSVDEKKYKAMRVIKQ